MKARNFLGSYLQKEDVPNPIVCTISGATEEQLDENERHKLVLQFKELEKGVVMNVTNINTLIFELKTDDTDAWVGNRVEMYVDTDVTFGGKKVGGIRFRRAPAEENPRPREAPPLSESPSWQPQVSRAPDAPSAPDEEVPF